MPREIKNCPLAAITKKGNIILFNHDVTVKGAIILELTTESIAEISIELYKEGIDIVSVDIDEARMNYIEVEL